MCQAGTLPMSYSLPQNTFLSQSLRLATTTQKFWFSNLGTTEQDHGPAFPRILGHRAGARQLIVGPAASLSLSNRVKPDRWMGHWFGSRPRHISPGQKTRRRWCPSWQPAHTTCSSTPKRENTSRGGQDGTHGDCPGCPRGLTAVWGLQNSAVVQK